METNVHPEPVVVGVDGSAASIDALVRARSIAARLGTHLLALTAWHEPIGSDALLLGPAWSPSANAAAVLDAAIVTAFGDAPPHDLARLAVERLPVRALVDASRHAEMLVLGSRGHSGIVGLLLGSVSAACAARAHCPVLIMHAHDVQATHHASWRHAAHVEAGS